MANVTTNKVTRTRRTGNAGTGGNVLRLAKSLRGVHAYDQFQMEFTVPAGSIWLSVPRDIDRASIDKFITSLNKLYPEQSKARAA